MFDHILIVLCCTILAVAFALLGVAAFIAVRRRDPLRGLGFALAALVMGSGVSLIAAIMRALGY